MRMRRRNPQTWLISAMKELGYKADEEGVCFGLACMGVQAILTGEIARFEQRLKEISRIPCYELKSAIDGARKKIIKANEPGGDKTSMTDLDWLLAEIPALFEGIMLYHDADMFSDVFASQKIISQDLLLISPFVLSKKLEKEGGISVAAKYTSIYSSDEVKEYVEILASGLDQNSMPVAFSISTVDHAITVGYEPHSKTWIVIDANKRDIAYIPLQNINELSNAIITAFSPFYYEGALKTEVYCLHSDELTLNYFKQLKENPNWKKLHDITSEKAKRKGLKGNSWLMLAANEGLLDEVNALIKAGADVNEMNFEKETPLYVAVQYHHRDVAQALLKAGASPNMGLPPLCAAAVYGYADIADDLIKAGALLSVELDGDSPLSSAAGYGHLDVVNVLIEAGTPLNNEIYSRGLPLCEAIYYQHIEVAKALINAGANLAIANRKGETPVFLAIRNYQKEILAVMKEKNPDFLSVVMHLRDSVLREFGKACKIEKHMEDFIKYYKSKLSHNEVEITPLQLLTFVGWTDLVSGVSETRASSSAELKETIADNIVNSINETVMSPLKKQLISDDQSCAREECEAWMKLIEAIKNPTNGDQNFINIFTEWRNQTSSELVNQPSKASGIFQESKNTQFIKKLLESFGSCKLNEPMEKLNLRK